MALSRTLLVVSAAAAVLTAASAELVADATADIASEEESECVSALQVTAPKRRAVAAVETAACEGPWCDALTKFCRLFDTNNPWKMQKAFDTYSEYASHDEGIKIAVTKDHFYEMYHGKIGQRLSEYLPQRLFAWKFDNNFEVMEPTGSDEATVSRPGTITFNLGWWRRKMFWNNVVQALPKGQVFPYSQVAQFDDCKECPAKMVFTLKNGGLDGEESKGWKVTGVSLIKLQ